MDDDHDGKGCLRSRDKTKVPSASWSRDAVFGRRVEGQEGDTESGYRLPSTPSTNIPLILRFAMGLLTQRSANKLLFGGRLLSTSATARIVAPARPATLPSATAARHLESAPEAADSTKRFASSTALSTPSTPRSQLTPEGSRLYSSNSARENAYDRVSN